MTQIKILVLIIGCICLLPCSICGTTYYVATNGNDSNNGRFPASQGGNDGPWLTVQKATDELDPGDTVLIRGGDYYVGSGLRVDRAGIQNAWIVYKAYEDGEVRITNSTVMPGLWSHERDNIYKSTILDGSQCVFCNGIPLVMPGSHTPINSMNDMMSGSAWLEGQTVYVWLPDSSDPSNAAMREAPYHAFSLYDCNYNVFDGLTVEYTYTAFKRQSETTHHIVIRNCTIRSIQNQGIQPVALNTIIENNLFQKIGTSKFHHGVYSGTDSIIYRYNIFEETAGAALHLYPSGRGSQVYGNIFRKPREMPFSGGYYAEIVAWGDGEHNIYNNLFYGEGLRSAISVNSSNNEIYNNTIYKPGNYSVQLDVNDIFMNNIVIDAPNGFISYRPEASGTQIDYNLYYNHSITPQWRWAGTSYSDFSAYKTASGESHSIYADPLFRDTVAGNLHLLAASPAIDSGLAVSWFNIDFEESTRPYGNGWDIGAYEFMGTQIESPLQLFSQQNNDLSIHITPNPFIYKTRIIIKFSGNRERLKIGIYNIAGRLIKAFTDQNILTWDGRDNDGHFQNSGLYLLKVSLKAKSATRRILLIR